MTISQAEELKRELTDRYVLVRSGVPELRRFEGLTGRVKTVNMSGRALVQFDGPVDIGWYDIDPDYLSVVEAPLPKTKGVQHAPAAAAPPKPAAKPASTGGGSPLDQIRKQAAPAASGGGKPSPLDLIRKQGAAGAAPASAPVSAGKESPLDAIRKQQAAAAGSAAAAEDKPATPAEADKPAPAAPSSAPDTSGLSPIELIRRQGAAKQ